MEKKYKRASEDPLYWILTIGFFLFGLVTPFVDINLTLSFICAILGVICYVLIFKNQRLNKINKGSS